MSYSRRAARDRFWEKVEKTDSCWLWRAGPWKDDLNVIGIFQLGRGEGEGLIRAPLFAWLDMGNEPPPPGYFLCHKCDTPKCVRPDHIFIGTPADNSANMAQKGRARCAKLTTCPRGHEYDYISPQGVRSCRQCRRELRRLRKERKGFWQ